MQSLNYCINPTMLSTTVALLLTAVATASPIPTVIVPFGALGNVRITSLSETLLRFEPQGPTGYEDRTTFTVVNRETFTGGADLKLINHTTNEAWLTRTGWDDIYIKFQGNGTGPTTSCNRNKRAQMQTIRPGLPTIQMVQLLQMLVHVVRCVKKIKHAICGSLRHRRLVLLYPNCPKNTFLFLFMMFQAPIAGLLAPCQAQNLR